MAKKQKVSLQRSEDFRTADLELTEAMDALEETNARVANLLEECIPAQEPEDESGAPPADAAPTDSPPQPG